MGTIKDYLDWRGDLSFGKDAFNDVDALILAMLSYLPYKDIVPDSASVKSISMEETADLFFTEDKPDEIKTNATKPTADVTLDSELVNLLKQAAQTPRFMHVDLCKYEENTDLVVGRQFAAVTYKLHNDRHEKVIAFRGTDNTLIGWKEDFELAYKPKIPAQESAHQYLEKTIGFFSSPFTVCGHSKGGNLAMYASSKLSGYRQKRLSRIINFDGPGFDLNIVPSASFERCAHKITNYVPEESVVGMLLEPVGERRVVSSNVHLINQHNALHWGIKRKAFIKGELSSTAKSIDQILKTWLKEISMSERKTLVEALFDILGASEGAVIDPKENIKDVKKIFQKYSDLDKNSKALLTKVFSLLSSQTMQVVTETIKEKLPKII